MSAPANFIAKNSAGGHVFRRGRFLGGDFILRHGLQYSDDWISGFQFRYDIDMIDQISPYRYNIDILCTNGDHTDMSKAVCFI